MQAASSAVVEAGGMAQGVMWCCGGGALSIGRGQHFGLWQLVMHGRRQWGRGEGSSVWVRSKGYDCLHESQALEDGED